MPASPSIDQMTSARHLSTLSTPIRVVVTGANRGIGKAICRAILQDTSITHVNLHATSRKGEDLNLAPTSATKTVSYHSLDIASGESIERFTSALSRTSKGVDVLINNAGVNLDNEYNLRNARTTLDVNYHGTVDLCRSLIPLMPSSSRIVMLSSVASSLRHYDEHIRVRLRDPNANLEDLDVLAEEFLHAVERGSEMDSGFGPQSRSYSVSKALLTAATRILARDNPSLLINACCPGWVATDMGALVGGGKAPKTPDQGARIPTRLAFGDIRGISGRYWANDSIRGKGDGEVQEW